MFFFSKLGFTFFFFVIFFSLFCGLFRSVLAFFLCLLRWFSHGDLDSQPPVSVQCVSLNRLSTLCSFFDSETQNRFNSAFLRNATVWCVRVAATSDDRAQENFWCLCTEPNVYHLATVYLWMRFAVCVCEFLCVCYFFETPYIAHYCDLSRFRFIPTRMCATVYYYVPADTHRLLGKME